jgi:Zn-dependent peptidase ImmA (M78 family)
MTPSLKKIQNTVAEILQNNGVIQAPVDVETIAANAGIDVRKTPAEDEISGFVMKTPAGGAVIGVNTLHHPNRQRFTIAHEIGHFYLHDLDEVHVDRFFVKLRDRRSSTGEDPQEVAANRFAAELLMPEHFLPKDLRELGMRDFLDDRAMLQLARKYQVSVQAMTNRLVGLGLISQSLA